MYYKYPRTPHLPWSPGATNDDKVLHDLSSFEGKLVVVTLKMDGEATTMYPDHIHARSINSKDHPSRHWVKALHGSIKHDIPDTMRICGENLFAKHSMYYDDLPSYFMGYSVWSPKNCLSWHATNFWLNKFGLEIVPVIWQGEWSYKNDMEKLLTSVFEPYAGEHEGYVVRTYDGFKREDFGLYVAKYVRPNHIQTDEHWLNKPIIKNGLSL